MKLRRLLEKDAEGMLEWMHDANIQKNFRKAMVDKTKEDVIAFIEDSEIVLQDGKSLNFAIVDDDDNYMGTISLKEIDMQSKSAEYAISLRASAQRKGIGTWATKEILKIAFEKYGLHRVYLNVLAENQAAIALYTKCGFLYEGEFRECLYLRGKYHNLKWFSVLNKE